jgi:hypothetical protein
VERKINSSMLPSLLMPPMDKKEFASKFQKSQNP